MSNIFDTTRQLLKNLKTGATSFVNKVGQSKTAQYFNPESNGGNNFWSGVGGQGLANLQREGLQNISPAKYGQFLQSSGQFAQSLLPQPVRKFTQPIVDMSLNTAQVAGTGAYNVFKGGGQTTSGIINNNPLKILQGMGSTAVGAGQVLAGGSPWFQVPNIIASGSQIGSSDVIRRLASGVAQGVSQSDVKYNVADKNVDILGYAFDPIKTIGNMAGFTKNPFNEKLYGATSKVFNDKVVSGLFQKGAIIGLKGGLEGLVQGFSSLPDNSTEKDIINYIAGQIAFGAASEIGTRSVGVVAGKLWKEFKPLLGDLGKNWNTPVVTMDIDPTTGKRIVMPMWKYQLKNKIGLSVQDIGKMSEEDFAKLSPEIQEKYKTNRGLVPDAQQPLSVTKGNPEVSTAGIKEQVQPQGVPPSQGGNVPSPKQDFENPSDPYYNIDRLNISDEAKLKIKSIVEGELKPTIQKKVGTKLTNKQIIKHAQAVNDTLVKSIGIEQTEELGAAQLRLRQNIARMSDTGQVTPELLDSIARDKAFSENTARLLQQRVINADPTTAQGKLMTDYLTEILKVNSDLDAILKAAKGVDFNNPTQATEFYRNFIKPTKGEWLDKLRYSSMLSSPNTHINNIVSNFQGTGVLTPIQKTIEGGIDKVVSAITGRARTRFTGEGAAYAKGYYSSVKQGYKDMLDVWKGVQSSENLDYRNIPLATKGVAGVVDKTLSVVPKALESMDRFFQALTKGGLEESYKYRLNKGVKVTADAEKEAKDLLFRGELTEKGKGAVSNAIGAGAEWVQQATNSKNKAVRWISKLTLPFVRTGTNLVKAGVEGNPLTGMANLIGNEDKIAQVSKMIMGGSVMALTVPLALSNRLTFSEPTDQKNRNAFREAGMLPYSIKIGDKWVSYSKLHPLLGFQIGTVAALTDAYKKSKINEDQGAILAEGLFGALKFFADQSYMKNVGDFVGTLSGDVEGFGRFVSNYPTQFIPFRAGMSWLNRMIDKYQRQPDPDANFFVKSLQQTMMQIPGLSQTVPERIGPSGQPIENKNRFINAFSPAKVSTENSEAKFRYDFTTNALRAYKNYKALSPEQKQQTWAKIVETNPEIARAIKKVAKDEKMGVTAEETDLRNKSVDERALSIKRKYEKLKTREEKEAFWKDYVDKGIITKEVAKQVKVLLSK